jgi:hypothetical protein
LTPGPVWTLWSREKFLAPVSIGNPAVAMPTERLMNDQLKIIAKNLSLPNIGPAFSWKAEESREKPRVSVTSFFFWAEI